jgi:hypothetical protein
MAAALTLLLVAGLEDIGAAGEVPAEVGRVALQTIHTFGERPRDTRTRRVMDQLSGGDVREVEIHELTALCCPSKRLDEGEETVAGEDQGVALACIGDVGMGD